MCYSHQICLFGIVRLREHKPLPRPDPVSNCWHHPTCECRFSTQQNLLICDKVMNSGETASLGVFSNVNLCDGMIHAVNSYSVSQHVHTV